MTKHRAILSGVLAGAMLWSVGCGSLGFRQPVPAALVGRAQVPGLPDVRLVLEPEQLDLTPARRFFGNAVERTANATRPPILLALSGGGDGQS